MLKEEHTPLFIIEKTNVSKILGRFIVTQILWQYPPDTSEKVTELYVWYVIYVYKDTQKY